MRWAKRWLLLAFLLASCLFSPPVEYDNTRSRWLALSAAVDYGRFEIDSFHEKTIDKSFFGGHYYSNKGVGSLLVAYPAYWLLRRLILPATPGVPEPALLYETHARFLVRVLTTSLPFALLGAAMFLALAKAVPARAAFWATAAYGLGTIALNHAAMFSGHQQTACLLFAAFLLLRGERRPALMFAAGLAAGLAVLVEYPAALAAAALSVWALGGRGRAGAKAAFVAGAGVCVLTLAAYNAACFGSPFVLSYFVLGDDRFAKQAAHGLVGITWPSLSAMAKLLASPSRGLFFIMPVLLYALPGLAAMRREGKRGEAAAIAALSAATLLLISAYVGWHGGWTFGPRYLVYVLPFLAWASAWAAGGRPAFLALLALSAGQVFLAQVVSPHTPEPVVNPLAELLVPLASRGYTAATLFELRGAPALFVGAALWLALAAALPFVVRGLPGPAEPQPAAAWERAFAGWGACVVLALAFVRSPNPERVRCIRSVLLADAAAELGDVRLAEASEAESDCLSRRAP
ncbi:MAG: hypothetical protein HY925_00400 [Elusimicrobia bacterium]|nr:hypothetical protein [Elusimicrobiota bacterium]